MQINHFKVASRQDILGQTHLRRFETKLGERLQVITDAKDIAASLLQSHAKFILFGIPEDIGILANEGLGGSATAWPSFLKAFLNIQSNDFLSGEEICLAGHFDFTHLKDLIDSNAYGPEEKLAAYRHAVVTIDSEVESLTKLIKVAGKIPIAIGGGHNNAYPLIKGTAKGLQQTEKIPLAKINCINLDAHTDYRPVEGRHSGNAFRYAEEDGFLQKYCVVGIHENYLQQNVWMDIVNNFFMDMITYEDIFIHGKRNFRQAVSHAIEFTADAPCGIELDLDSIEHVLCSASSPSGLSTLAARQYINLCAAHAKAAYLHICEGAVSMADGREDASTGKLISYLVSDFIKMYKD